ncbi:hypothetical protein [Dokdonella soli]|uniref:Uncharacterized protein n=1 Tax=Dokdonella soli TaxID=529810 RepID=A0ABN1ILJ8_9GAMM
MKLIIPFALVLFAMISPAAAKESKYHEVVNASSQDRLEQLVVMVQGEMKPGGRYEFVKPDERKTIDAKFAEMLDLLKRKGSIEAMQQDEKVRLFNAQEMVNSILTRRDSDRVICENRTPIGSHIPQTSCHTYGQAEEARHDTVKKMMDWDHIACVDSKTSEQCMHKPHVRGPGEHL